MAKSLVIFSHNFLPLNKFSPFHSPKCVAFGTAHRGTWTVEYEKVGSYVSVVTDILFWT